MELVKEMLLDFDKEAFQQGLLQWYEENKRDLPWRRERDPYKIWVSEIMLQQTQVDTVIPYYERFMAQFPTVEALAEAEEEVVLKAWEGLGYYSRARNLHSAVKDVRENYDGQVPDTLDEVQSLRGVGPYTAGAIMSIAFDKPVAAVDGNVMRVFSRIFLVTDDISQVRTRKKFEFIVTEVISSEYPGEFNQALMDLGATLCTPRTPKCQLCPVKKHCIAFEKGVQDQLPVKKRKNPPQHKKIKALVLFNDEGDLLIEKRGDEGLLASLWQFPNMELVGADDGRLGLENYLRKTGGLQVEIGSTVVQEVNHVFTHLIWDIDVYEGKVLSVDDADLFSKSEFRFVNFEEIEKYPFPVSHQKILKAARERIS